MNEARLHHESQFAPNTFVLPADEITLTYSNHALDRAIEYNLRLPVQISLAMFKVIEIEFTGAKVTKLLIRGAYNSKEDLLLALIPGRNFVKTCWTNRKNDQHRTLDMSKYSPLN